MSKRQINSNSERRQFWQIVIETWQNSGMSVARFCKAEGLSEGAFYNLLRNSLSLPRCLIVVLNTNNNPRTSD